MMQVDVETQETISKIAKASIAVPSPPRHHKNWGWTFLIPSVTLVVLFNYYPAVRSFIGSLTAWNGFNPPTFVGLANFINYFQQPVFWPEMRNIAVLSVGGVIIALAFPFLAAEVTLGLRSIRGQNITKYLLVIPMVVPSIVLINIWAYLLNPTDGLIDGFLRLFTVPPIQWLGNPHTALLSILLIGFPWVSSLGYLIFLAGLQGLPQEVLDAAEVDGCVGTARVWKIDIPLCIPQIRFVMIIAGVSIVQNFIPILLLTEGGPANATMIPGLQMYNYAFSNNQLGYGMAIGTLLFVVMLAATFLALKVLKTRT